MQKVNGTFEFSFAAVSIVYQSFDTCARLLLISFLLGA